MKRKFRKFQEGGEVDIPRRKPLRDQYNRIVRSGTGEPIMTAGEMDENDLRELNPEAMTGFEGSVKNQVVPPPPSPTPPERPTVNAPLAPRPEPGTGDAEIAQDMAARPREDRKAAGVSASQSRPPAAVSAARPPAAVSAARPPAAVSAARPLVPPSAIASGGGRGIAAGKTAAQEAMLTGSGRGKEAAKTAVQEAIGSGRGKYPGKTAEQEAMLQKKLKDKEVPSVDEIRAQNARTSTGTSAKEKIEAGSSDLLTKALAVPAVGAAGYGIKKGIDLLRRRKPKQFVKPGDRKEPKLGMNKGGRVQKAPSPPDMGSSKYEPDLNKPKPKKKSMADDMDMFMARSGGLAKKIDGIALRGKTRGKMM